MSVSNKINVNFNDMKFEYESNKNAKDTADIDVEDFDTEFLYESYKKYMFLNSNMSENPVYRFVATFTLLKIYKQNFQFLTSLSGLQYMIEFCELFKSIRQFVVCKNYYEIYKENQSIFSHYIFAKTDTHSALQKLADTICNVYNDAVWKELKNSNAVSFVEQSCLLILILILNIDWFQLFDKVTYSSSAIYLTTNNLPHSDQLKAENVILVELMSGLSKPTR
ncbi:hypothetical protein PHYBLDRAFT_69628 [Phycomyces blakesleeanus NRRL 1555(-)]|uniref:Uncharacterized protein n=1 Tax=Phycomyces blakesleeanus (strain ATCC 8743b / DSM 1359 / FGSC 10004 / NBRC 33097 / NRRL 1555) TaxID=763407 RepID=A0A163A231_PHYB8|nr:hypothetical protein PHYBLDRAFT_69628 [Phycomyces blakesleeanus NRRL 1555(-)]OAD70541.1 hypothetical protein PHYBLDRAFT_69628 [Phycomyces blakesleeanus NRRL 1555(-)]|eukprot:XP_018288581.1 hypothetical protein PHYBLDRAFT_69628 [Phycomyces blakesleeanus NRRL 1555(-)]